MDINIEITYLIVTWFLAIVDVVLFSIICYSIYLFRKSTYDFEKRFNNQNKTKTQ